MCLHLLQAYSENVFVDPRVPASPAGVDYTLTFEESVVSSHTATDDEIDYRMILPSESHRRRSLSKTGRRGSIGSDQGTVSYSSVRVDPFTSDSAKFKIDNFCKVTNWVKK